MIDFSDQYKIMCEKAKKIFDHYFDPGDYFIHEFLGIQEVDINRGDGFMYCTEPEYSTFNIDTTECVWLPTVEQLMELAESYNLKSETLKIFLHDDKGYYGYPTGIKPESIFRTPEEQWIVFYLREINKLIWINQEWKKLENDSE